ncbi:MAG: hypothetical protein KIC77_05730 [Clostridiales bacterium]|nr:hypothetical protein [Clostridiales bacterium]
MENSTENIQKQNLNKTEIFIDIEKLKGYINKMQLEIDLLEEIVKLLKP